MGKRGPKPNDKLANRNQAMADARRQGLASLQMLATEYGVSRERVRQITESLGVDNKAASAAFTRHKHDQDFKEAEPHAGAIIMRYAGGEGPVSIARSLNFTILAVKSVLDEYVTDEILASRTLRQFKKRHPTTTLPREVNEPRKDRFWTEQRVRQALLDFTAEPAQNGVLPSCTQYDKIARTREDLPSLATARNRLGGWTAVRVEINNIQTQGEK